jgi:hypothetical protein
MSGARRDWLSDAKASSRQLAADAGLLGVPEVECANQCGRWIRLGSGAVCNHVDPVCDDCWPAGCDECERQLLEDDKHRGENTNAIISAVKLLITSVDDLSDNDLRSLGHLRHKDTLRAAVDGIEALRRVRDVLRDQEERSLAE